MALQLAALALSAGRIPLAAQYPQSAEFEAVRVMLAAQFGGLSLLFPWLLPNLRTSIVAAACGWIMLLAAAALGAWPLAQAVPAGAFLTGWMIVLATVRAATPSRLPVPFSAIASVYIIGGPLVAYLHREFANAPVAAPNAAFGPLFSAISTPHHLPPQAWVFAAGIEIIAGLALATRFKRRKSAPLPSSSGS